MAWRKAVLFLAVAAILLPVTAKADSLVFTFGNGGKHGVGLTATTFAPGGVISNQIPTLTQHVSLATLFSATHAPSGPSISGSNIGGVGFTTGTFISKVANVVTFAGGGNITITASNLGGIGIPNGTVLFSGFFNGNSVFTISGVVGQPNSHIGTLAGQVVTSTLNPILLTLLGIPFQPVGTAVVLDIDLRVGTGGVIQNGSITLVPEPGTLALFGTGLMGLAGLVRRRLK